MVETIRGRTNWSAYENCKTCNQPIGLKCIDLRRSKTYTVYKDVPHKGRPRIPSEQKQFKFIWVADGIHVRMKLYAGPATPDATLAFCGAVTMNIEEFLQFKKIHVYAVNGGNKLVQFVEQANDGI